MTKFGLFAVSFLQPSATFMTTGHLASLTAIWMCFQISRKRKTKSTYPVVIHIRFLFLKKKLLPMADTICDNKSASNYIQYPKESSYYCCNVRFKIIITDTTAHCFTPNSPTSFHILSFSFPTGISESVSTPSFGSFFQILSKSSYRETASNNLLY